jgi:hypothetical protein
LSNRRAHEDISTHGIDKELKPLVLTGLMAINFQDFHHYCGFPVGQDLKARAFTYSLHKNYSEFILFLRSQREIGKEIGIYVATQKRLNAGSTCQVFRPVMARVFLIDASPKSRSWTN